jgi:hypothetical protein
MAYNPVEKGVVTALRNIDEQALSNLAKNHQWS